MLKAFTFVLLLTGIGLVGYGLYRWDNTLGYILAGVVLIIVSILFAAEAYTPRKGGDTHEGEDHVQHADR